VGGGQPRRHAPVSEPCRRGNLGDTGGKSRIPTLTCVSTAQHPGELIIDKPGKGSSHASDVGNDEAALKIVTMQGGVFGAVATSATLLTALGA
jgi:hypothetical protein